MNKVNTPGPNAQSRTAKKKISSYDHKRVVVKILDDRGIESLKIVEIEA